MHVDFFTLSAGFIRAFVYVTGRAVPLVRTVAQRRARASGASVDGRVGDQVVIGAFVHVHPDLAAARAGIGLGCPARVARTGGGGRARVLGFLVHTLAVGLAERLLASLARVNFVGRVVIFFFREGSRSPWSICT